MIEPNTDHSVDRNRETHLGMVANNLEGLKCRFVLENTLIYTDVQLMCVLRSCAARRPGSSSGFPTNRTMQDLKWAEERSLYLGTKLTAR